jgi:hypothetical protein
LFKRGKEFERRLRPLSLILPSSVKRYMVYYHVPGWRGARGEV